MSPDVWARKKAIFSGVTASAAMIRSPSFSRSSSSTTTTISPRPTASIASSTDEKGIDPLSPLCSQRPAAVRGAGPRCSLEPITSCSLLSACTAPALGNFWPRSVRPQPSAGRQFDPQIALQASHRAHLAPPQAASMVAAPGPANSGRASSPRTGREPGRGHTRSTSPAAVEGVGHRRAPLHQDLQDPPVARARRAPPRGRPPTSRAGRTAAPSGARPEHHPDRLLVGAAEARIPGGSRTVSAGSSARTVPAPTSTASDRARSRWASRRAAGPVIHRLVPSGAAVRPSSVAASLRTTQGRPVRRCFR